jgi:hypothetical protein
VTDDNVLFSDASLGQIYTFTHTGTFTGNLAKDGNCEGSDNFSPYKIAEIDNVVYATCHKENAIKELVDGRVTSSITTSELGYPEAKPMSIALNDYYMYVSLDNGKLISMYYGLDLAEETDIDCAGIETYGDKLFALTTDSRLITFDAELNTIETDDFNGHYINQLIDPIDLSIDSSGNFWFLQKDRCVTVWYEDGGWGSWGDKYIDRYGNHWGINGDPIAGRDGVFPANSIDVGDDYFYLTRKDGHGLAVERSDVNLIPEPSMHFVSIFMSSEDYNKYATDIWKLQQYLYPRTLVAVFDTNNDYDFNMPTEGIFLDGRFFSNDFGELIDPFGYADDIRECFIENPVNHLSHDSDHNSLSVNLDGMNQPFDTKLLVLQVKGSKTPLIVDSVNVSRPDISRQIIAETPLSESSDLLYAILLDRNDSCIGARIIRN